MWKAYWGRVASRAARETRDRVEPRKGVYGVSLAVLGSAIGVGFFGVRESDELWRVAASGVVAVALGYAVMFAIQLIRGPAALDARAARELALVQEELLKLKTPPAESPRRQRDRVKGAITLGYDANLPVMWLSDLRSLGNEHRHYIGAFQELVKEMPDKLVIRDIQRDADGAITDIEFKVRKWWG